MNGDLLRRAATLMRERAAAAPGGRWWSDGRSVRAPGVRAACAPGCTRDGAVVNASGMVTFDKGAVAEHIASMDPNVALAVANVLDAAADYIDDPSAYAPREEDLTQQHRAEILPGLVAVIARAYLREPQP